MASPVFRTGFYAILDTGYVEDEAWESKAESLLAGGACLLQVRAKGCLPEEVLELTSRVRPLAVKYGTPLIVNDHLEVALHFPEVGLHLGQDDMDIREARDQLGGGRILGHSTHSLEQAEKAIAAADVLSYFAVGPVFATGTKPSYQPVGLRLVKQVAAKQPPLPFFCIGGISRENVDSVIEAGARGIVAVSDPLLDPDTGSAAAFFAERLA